MNLDNILRTINQYIEDIFETFGGQSKEYMRAMKQVKEALPERVLNDTVRQGLDYESDAPTEPLKFSRSKAAKEELSSFSEDIRQLRAEQRETGGIRQLKKQYIEDAKELGKDPKKIDFQEEAQKKYDFDNSTNDWYEEVMEDEDIADDEKEYLRDMYSNLHDDYEEAAFRDELEDTVKALKQRSRMRRLQRNMRGEEAAQEEPPADIGYHIDDDFGGIGL